MIRGEDDFTFSSVKDTNKIHENLITLKCAKMEIPSCNMTASARGLAKIAAMVANGGTWEGKEYITPEVYKEMHEVGYSHAQALTGFVCSYTKGGMYKMQSIADLKKECHPDAVKHVGDREELVARGRHGYYGWCGTGGAMITHHPELKIGFGFVPSTLLSYDAFYRESGELQGIAAECARRL